MGYNLEGSKSKMQKSNFRMLKQTWYISGAHHQLREQQAMKKRSFQMAWDTYVHSLWTAELYKRNWMKQTWIYPMQQQKENTTQATTTQAALGTFNSRSWFVGLHTTLVIHDLMRSLQLVVLVPCTQPSTSESWGSVITVASIGSSDSSVQQYIFTQSLSRI